MKPKALDTLQVSTPTLTPCACAGVPSIKLPAAKPSAQIAIASFLSIPSTSCLSDPLGRSQNGGSYSVVSRGTLRFSLPAVSPAGSVLDCTVCYVRAFNFGGRRVSDAAIPHPEI